MPDRYEVGEHWFLLIRPSALRGYRARNRKVATTIVIRRRRSGIIVTSGIKAR